MRTKVVWLLIGAALALLASEALARTLTTATARTKAEAFGKSEAPVSPAQVTLDSYGCKRGKTTLSNGERVDDLHRVYCQIREHRDAATQHRCVVVTMRHRTNLLGQTSYPVSANRGPTQCPAP